MLQSEQFYDFFKYVEVSTFDIASDAFSTFKVYFWLRDHEKNSCSTQLSMKFICHFNIY